MTKFLNLTPHAISIKTADFAVTVQPSGFLARVSTTEEVTSSVAGIPVIRRSMGAVEIVFEGESKVLTKEMVTVRDTPLMLVSSMVLEAIQADSEIAPFVFAPDTGATAERNDKGHIVSVCRLVGK